MIRDCVLWCESMKASRQSWTWSYSPQVTKTTNQYVFKDSANWNFEADRKLVYAQLIWGASRSGDVPISNSQLLEGYLLPIASGYRSKHFMRVKNVTDILDNLFTLKVKKHRPGGEWSLWKNYVRWGDIILISIQRPDIHPSGWYPSMVISSCTMYSERLF